MKKSLKSKVKQFPNSPGIYRFLNKEGEILYIGKATCLKSRVLSYFTKDIEEKRGAIIKKLLEKTYTVDFQKTATAIEALILEAREIKKHQPPFNSKEKSDKSFVYLIISDEEYPKVFIKRQKEFFEKKLDVKIKYFFGPFSSRKFLEESLKIIRKIFPFFSKKNSYASKSPLYKQMGYSPSLGISQKEYLQNILNIKLFFEGKKNKVLKSLEKEMNNAAKALDFEKAEYYKKQFLALKYLKDIHSLDENIKNEKFRIEAYDISHFAGENQVGVMTVVENRESQKQEYRLFNIKSLKKADDTKALKEVLERRFQHKNWAFPDLIVTDGGLAQKRVVEKFLKERGLLNIAVVSCKKNQKHKVEAILGKKSLIEKHKKEILLANAESHRFSLKSHRRKRQKEFLS